MLERYAIMYQPNTISKLKKGNKTRKFLGGRND